MKVKFKKLVPEAVIPTKAHITDFGADLTATSVEHDNHGNYVYGTGIAVEIPEGYVGLLFPRSSNAKQNLLLSNSVGVIDSGYRGEIMMKFKVLPYHIIGECDSDGSNERYRVIGALEKSPYGDNVLCEEYCFHYQVGERIGQLAIVPYPEVEWEEAEELSETDRGTGGYGSSGKYPMTCRLCTHFKYHSREYIFDIGCHYCDILGKNGWFLEDRKLHCGGRYFEPKSKKQILNE